MRAFLKSMLVSGSGTSSKRVLAAFLIVLPTLATTAVFLIPSLHGGLQYIVAYITPCYSTATLLLGLTSFEKKIKEKQKE